MRSGSGAAAPFGGGALADGVRALAARGARHRRLAAALLAAAAVVAAVQTMTPAAPPAPAASRAPGSSGSLAAGFDPAAVGAAGAGRTAVAVRLADAAGLLLAAPGRHVDVLAGAGGRGSGAPSDVAATGPAEVVAADAVVLAVPEPPGSGSATDAEAVPLPGVLGGSAGVANGSGGLAGIVVLAVHPGDVPRLAGGARALLLALPLPGL